MHEYAHLQRELLLILLTVRERGVEQRLRTVQAAQKSHAHRAF